MIQVSEISSTSGRIFCQLNTKVARVVLIVSIEVSKVS